MSESTPHIKAEQRGVLGLLTLNRPQALNALDHGMILALTAQLRAWAADDGVQTVAIRGEGERAFCSGGDIRAVQQAVVAGSDAGIRFLHDEYQMNALIGAYPKPYIALIHGICMGGGAGLSVHGRHRLADVSLVFAMPETGIGFIPDIGASYFLSRMPGEMGMYLGLTGLSIGLDDALDAGLVTHAVARKDFGAVIDALAAGREFAPFVRKAQRGQLSMHRGRIATLFAAGSVEAILERLDRDGSEFAQATAQTIRTRSPSSLKLVFRQLRFARELTLRECLAMEFRLANRVLPSHDFREGIRAALLDKDRNPRWEPASLAGVGNVESFFAPIRDELF
ncbi:MAG TPA: enoyl-CoA hydratase/isomerase family protein [Rhizomicrobium sp.]|jgi:enoyl-CoA hydratase